MIRYLIILDPIMNQIDQIQYSLVSKIFVNKNQKQKELKTKNLK